MKLYMIRHGTVQGNLEKRFVGITDESLTGEGRAAIEEKAAEGVYPAADLLISSPLLRCLETAAVAFPGKEAVRLPEWAEIRFGDFEYGNYVELSADPRYQAWIDSGGEMAFPGGESRAEYCDRVILGFRKVCKMMRELEAQSLHADEYDAGACGAEPLKTPAAGKEITAAAVVHLGTMKALLSSLLDMGYFDIQAANGCGYVLDIDPDAEKLLGADPFPAA